MTLATLEALEAVVGTVADTARATTLLEMASGEVEEFCHRRFAYIEDDEITVTPVWSGRPSNRLRLPSGPLVSVSAVSRGGFTYAPTSYTTEGDYLVFGCVDIINLDAYRLDPVNVTYTHGYETIPSTVVSVVCGMAGRALAGDIGVSNESLGSYSVGMRDDTGNGVSLSANDEARLRRAGFVVEQRSRQMVRN